MIENLAAGVQAFTSNAFLLAGDRPVVVDTGANFDITSRLTDRSIKPTAVVLTHTHPDHVGNLAAITETYDVPVWGFDATNDDVDHAVADGDTLRLGDHEYRALHTPGHAPDHLCLHSPDAAVLFAGDLIFQNGSFGRTDLPNADRNRLVQSLDYVLETVPPSLTELHPGHGPSITDNPYQDIQLARRYATQLD